MSGFRKLLHWIDAYVEQTLMAILLAVIVVLIGVNVFMRKT